MAEDLRWWAGWTKTQCRWALAGLELVEVDLDGAAGLVLADDLEPPPAPPEPVLAAAGPGLDAYGLEQLTDEAPEKKK